MDIIATKIAGELGVQPQQVSAAITLLDDIIVEGLLSAARVNGLAPAFGSPSSGMAYASLWGSEGVV